MRCNLVVDDDLHTGLAICAWLKRNGFRVATADGGANGLAALEEASFDRMIVDIFMPHMRGYESMRIFHQRAPTVPLIAIPGYAFSGPETDNPVSLKDGSPRRRHAMPAQAVPARNSAQCHR